MDDAVTRKLQKWNCGWKLYVQENGVGFTQITRVRSSLLRPEHDDDDLGILHYTTG